MVNSYWSLKSCRSNKIETSGERRKADNSIHVIHILPVQKMLSVLPAYRSFRLYKQMAVTSIHKACQNFFN